MSGTTPEAITPSASSLRDRDATVLELPLVKIFAHKLLIILFQFIHCIRPYNAYNDAIIEEFIENTKFERSQSQTGAATAGASETGGPVPHLDHWITGPARGKPIMNSRLPAIGPPREPFIILLMKLLLRARIDLLQRVHAVLERDNETLERLGEEQARQIDRLRSIYEDLFMRMGHMEKLLQLRTVQLIELRQRVDSAQLVSADGTFVWNIDQVAKRQNDAVTGKQMSLYSPAFFVHRYGYKMCLRLYLNGDGLGKSTHMSLFVVVMRSPWDALLRWPFKQKITLLLYDQNFRAHIIDAFKPDDLNSSFRRPHNLMNIASGSSLFVPLCMLRPEENQENAYIKEDRLYVKVIIDCADLPSLDHAK
jgi:hypothetical protein